MIHWFKAHHRLMVLIGFVGLSFQGCETKKPLELRQISGRTMGTSYNISYADLLNRDFKAEVDSLLAVFNQSVSTYEPNSTISRFNRDTSRRFTGDRLLNEMVFIALEVAERTKGAFDPTVMPLVNYFGFGPEPATSTVDSSAVDSIRQFVGYRKLGMRGAEIERTHPQVQLDLSAIAKGAGVERVADYLEMNGVKHYLVEIGGEVTVSAAKPDGSPWLLAVDKPVETGARQLQARLPLRSQAMATSGNYRNYKTIDGRKVVHTVNPTTGYPERSRLLSATVVTANCAEADALATAFMVMGLEKTQAFLADSLNTRIEALLIYTGDDDEFSEWQTPGLDVLGVQ